MGKQHYSPAVNWTRKQGTIWALCGTAHLHLCLHRADNFVSCIPTFPGATSSIKRALPVPELINQSSRVVPFFAPCCFRHIALTLTLIVKRPSVSWHWKEAAPCLISSEADWRTSLAAIDYEKICQNHNVTWIKGLALFKGMLLMPKC